MRLAIVLVLLTCFLTGSLLSQESTSFFTIQTHLGQIPGSSIDSATVISVLDSIQKAGITCIRDEMYWSIVETSPGVFNFPPNFDFYVDQAAIRGISVLLILDYNNPLYAAHAGAGITTDTNRAMYLRYCKAVLNRYIPKGIKTYEIWNEPNIPQFWDPAPNASDYTQLLRTVYPALKQLDSSVTILACATSPAEGNPAPYIEWKQYISSVFQQGGGSYMDGVSFHLYRVEKAPELFIDADLNALQAIVGTNKKLYITECGYHTSSAWPNLSVQKQAEYISRLYLLAHKNSALKTISYYDFRNDGETLSEPEHNFGIVYYNLSPKPAYIYLKSLISEIRNKSFLSNSVQNNYYRYTFGDSTEKTNVFWSTVSVSAKTESFGTNRLRIKNSTEELSYLYTSSKIVSIPYTTAPLFYTELQSFPPLVSLQIVAASDSLVINQRIQLQARGLLNNGGPLIIENNAGIWKSLDTNASISASGMLQAHHVGTCRISYTFENTTVIRTFTILPAYTEMELLVFNGTFALSFQSMLPETQIALTDSNYRTPPNSLLLQYALQYQGIDKHKVIFDFTGAAFPGEPDSLFIDVYNNGNGHIINFIITDADGQDFSVNSAFSALTGSYGWKTVKVSLQNFGSTFNHPARLKRLTFYCVKSGGIVDSIYRGKVLLDNVRIHNGITVSTEEHSGNMLNDFYLHQNYPNPFNPETTIRYRIGMSGSQTHVNLSIYDILGRRLSSPVDTMQQPGEYAVTLRGDDMSSGIYFYRLQAGLYSETKKLILLK